MEANLRLSPAFWAFWAVAAVGCAVLLLYCGAGVGPDWVFTWVYVGLMVMAAASCLWRAAAVRAERVAWTVMGAGLLSWTFGELCWTLALNDYDVVPVPSIADAGYLLYYPAAFVTLVLLFRERVREFRSSHWLDGVIAALAVASLASAVAFRPIVEATTGDAVAIAVNLAYPLGDLVLLSIVVAIFGLSGWRPGPGMALPRGRAGPERRGRRPLPAPVRHRLLCRGRAARRRVADRDPPGGHRRVAAGAAPREGPSRGRARDRHSLRLRPDRHRARDVGPLRAHQSTLALVLATGTLVAVVIRMALVFAENQTMLTTSRDEARTDALTGLRNRRSLMGDLEAELERATLETPVALILFDLDGFKDYNDAFGHPAGDGLLARLGERLEDAVARLRPRLPPRRRRVLRARPRPARPAPSRRGRRPVAR